MAPRARKPVNRPLPANLRCRDGYYSYRNPLTGTEYGIGRNEAVAIAEARRANIHLAGQRQGLVERMTASDPNTWGAWLKKYGKLIAARDLKDNTRRTLKSLTARAARLWDESQPVKGITTAMIADALDAIIEDDKARTAQAFRSFLKDCFREAMAQGWIDRNPVDPTRAVAVTVNRSRLTLDAFQSIHAAAHPWLQNAMVLALVTGQRREDISAAKFADIRDGHWWLTQSKGGKRLAIPLSLRLDALGLSLEDVAKRCRGTGVLSHYLIHQTDDYGNSKRGAQIWVDTISRRFTDALAPLGLAWGDKSPPTFHEIRSLSARLYTDQGGVKVQDLLGHSDADMTAVYQDGRGEWIKVKTTV